MDRLKKHIPPFIVLVVLAILVVSFRPFLMTNIIEPIAFFFWAIWRVISSVNQGVYWLILVAISLILVIRLVPFEDDNPPRSAYSYRYRSPSRVEYWKKLLNDAPLDKQETEHLRSSLKRLLSPVIAQANRFPPQDLDEVAAIEDLPLSRRAKNFLFPPKRGIFATPGMPGITFLIPGWLRRWAGKFAQHDTRAIDEILSYLETQMEISHDR